MQGTKVVIQDTTDVVVRIEPDVVKLHVSGTDTNVKLSDGAPGAVGPFNEYNHTQSSASTIWTVNHNLGRYPEVTLRTTGGVVFDGMVTHVTANQIVVNLTVATAGTARCV